jgi:uncharacterized protein
VLKNRTTLYKIPVDDKFIIYAPLLPLAFIGNAALVKILDQKLANPGDEELNNNEFIQAFERAGLFEPDRTRFQKIDTSQSFSPSLCILMPTTACNLACTYCYAEYDEKKHVFMSWPIAKKAMDIAFENSKKPGGGCFSLSFHGGGEPTLPNEFFLKAADYARELDPNCPVSVTTNAVWDAEFRERALCLLSEVSISFDGGELTQNRQRPDKQGRGTFSRVMETISDIEKRKIPYGIRMTVTRESLPELRANIEFLCKNTECRSFQVEAVYNQGRAKESGLTIDDIYSFTDTYLIASQFAAESGRNIHYSAARPHLITNTFCTATSNALIVTSDGELTACYEVFDHSHPLADDFIIGRIDISDGLVLYPGKRNRLLEKININRLNCKECFCYFHCAGDCPPKAFLAQVNNDQLRCEITRTITRELLIDLIAENEGFWKGGFPRKKCSENCINPEKC